MQSDRPLRERMMQNLEQAIDRLNEDFERVEFWAAAVDAFRQPVPEYEAAQGEYLLPRK
jgi:hypothetical protein